MRSNRARTRALEIEMRRLRDEMHRTRDDLGFIAGSVVSVNHGTRIATVRLNDGQTETTLLGHAGYNPEVGEDVQLMMNGNVPILLPSRENDCIATTVRTETIGGPDRCADRPMNAGSIDGWDGDVSLAAWLFGSSAESWTTVAGTSGFVSIGARPNTVGWGVFRVRGSGGGTAMSAVSPTGTSGRPCAPGDDVHGSLFIATGYFVDGLAEITNVRLGLRWYDSGGSLLSTTVGAWQQPLHRNIYYSFGVDGVAPASAAFVSLLLETEDSGYVSDHVLDCKAGIIVVDSSTPPQTVAVNTDTDYVYNGASSSLALEATTGARVLVQSSGAGTDGIAVWANTYYSIGARYVNDVGNAAQYGLALFVRWFNAAGELLQAGLGSAPTRVDAGWHEHSDIVFAPEGAAFAQVGAFTPSSVTSGSIIYIDDVALCEATIIKEAKLLTRDMPLDFRHEPSHGQMSISRAANPSTPLSWVASGGSTGFGKPAGAVNMSLLVFGSAIATGAGTVPYRPAARMTISLDGGATWRWQKFGQMEIPAVDKWVSFVSFTGDIGPATGPILIRPEVWSSDGTAPATTFYFYYCFIQTPLGSMSEGV